MSLKFTGRESQLAEIDRLIKDKQGAVFAVSGNAGIGKSTLLKEVSRRCPQTGQVFIDINDVPPLQIFIIFKSESFILKNAPR